jgi:lipoate-protein ligase A
MQLLDYTAPTPAENLAVDEALLDEAEAANHPREVLRLWEPQQRFVVLGRSCQAAREVNLQCCRADGIAVLRRSSGGGTILTGPGCLMYAVVLSLERQPELRSIEVAHRYVLARVASGLNSLVGEIARAGTSDLALGQQKCSGNSLRCRRDHLLYHGTLMYACAPAEIGKYLWAPPREPEYRRGRSHTEFLTNLPVNSLELRTALIAAWRCQQPYGSLPERRIERLVAEKYGCEAWNLQR